MKCDHYYALESVCDGLEERIKELENEIDRLDPSATWELQMIVARLKGLQSYTIKKLDQTPRSRTIEVVHYEF